MRGLRKSAILHGVVVGLFALAEPLLSQVDIRAAGDHVAVNIDGKPFTDFYTGSPYPKPFLHPLRSADGRIVTRQFPMATVDGESHDHPHHRGLFVGYGSINGINFWENEKSYTTSNRGLITLKGTPRLTSGKTNGVIEAIYDWQDPAGKGMLEEDRTMTFYSQTNLRTIDFDITFTALQDLHFDDTKEGFFAIRVADSMKEDNGGQMVSSTGSHSEKQIWGTKAEWVDYSGNVDGRPVGITIFDDPTNQTHPPRWHSRAYGLFAVNPWGQKEFDKTAPGEGGLTLKTGNKVRVRYRVLIHDKPMTPAELSQAYESYVKRAS